MPQLPRIAGPDEYGLARTGGRFYAAPALYDAALTVIDDHAISTEPRSVRLAFERVALIGAYVGQVRLSFLRPVRLLRMQAYLRNPAGVLYVVTSSTLRHNCQRSSGPAGQPATPDELALEAVTDTPTVLASSVPIPVQDWDELASGTGRITYEHPGDGLTLEPVVGDAPAAVGVSALSYVWARVAGAPDIDVAVVHVTYRLGVAGAIPR